MPFLFVFLPSAKSDLQSAAKWYESKQLGLGKRFKEEVINTIDSIDNPLKEYGTSFQGLSRVFLKKFPYIVYFKKDLPRQKIVVFAILHEKQEREPILNKRI